MRRHAVAGLVIGMLLVVATGTAHATPIIGSPYGLLGPHQTITFDELGDLQGQVITDQFSSLGVELENVGWDGGNVGQRGATGFAGGSLVNGGRPFPRGPVCIRFARPVGAAAFAALDKGGSFTVTAWFGGIGGYVVESYTATIPPKPWSGFIGFTGVVFDSISVVGNAWVAIDTLQFNAAPVITAEADRTVLWPPNHKSVTVNVSGVVEDESPVLSSSLTVERLYGQFWWDLWGVYEITVADDGSFSVPVALVTQRDGRDRDGQLYRLTVWATDDLGTPTRSDPIVVVMPHDQR